MADFRDIESICKKNNVSISILPASDGSSTLISLQSMIVLSQDWIDFDYIDDNLFEMLVAIGRCVSNGLTGDSQSVFSVNWAILQAKKNRP